MTYKDPLFLTFLKNVIQGDLRHDCYKESCDHCNEMSVHLYGKNPEKLLNAVRPREDAETKTYRLSAYQATTKATAGKALSIVAKIFNPTIWSIRWKDQTTAGRQLENYTLKEYPVFNSLINFLSESVTKKMLADPNGMIAIRPGNLTIPETERALPVARVYGSPNIWWKDKEMVLIWIKTVDDPNPRKNKVYYFEYYDATEIIEFDCYFTTPVLPPTIELIASYTHGCGEMPIWELKGIPELLDNGSVIFKSFFDDALPFWNLAITHESDLFGAYVNHLHPLRAELAEECDYIQDGQKCRNGLVNKVIGGVVSGGTFSCPSCHGTGYRSVKSPYGVYQYDKEKLDGTTGSITPVQYITIPTEATKMLEARVDKMHDRGLNAINMDVANKVGENQSGIAKVIDRSELNDFLGKIANVIFDIHLTNIFYYFNIIMFKVSQSSKPNDPLTPDNMDANLPEINKPINFDVATASELLTQMDSTKKAGFNPEYMRQAGKEIIAKKFATNPDIKIKMDLVVDLDPLPDLAVADIIALQSGAQKAWPIEHFIIHFNMGNFVDRALDEDEAGFLGKDEDQKFEVLMGFAKEVIDATKTKIDPSVVAAMALQQQSNQPFQKKPMSQMNPKP